MNVIDNQSQDAFHSKAFEDISQGTLSYVLNSDNLLMEEIDIFKQCLQLAGKKNDKKSARDVLGKALNKIRFPTMTLTDFTNVVRPTYILTTDEQSCIHVYLAVPEERNKPSLFNCVKRNSRTCNLF